MNIAIVAFQKEETDFRMRLVSIQVFATSICRAIIDNNYLNVGISLCKQAIQTLLKEVCMVIARNDDADQFIRNFRFWIFDFGFLNAVPYK